VAGNAVPSRRCVAGDVTVVALHAEWSASGEEREIIIFRQAAVDVTEYD